MGEQGTGLWVMNKKAEKWRPGSPWREGTDVLVLLWRVLREQKEHKCFQNASHSCITYDLLFYPHISYTPFTYFKTNCTLLKIVYIKNYTSVPLMETQSHSHKVMTAKKEKKKLNTY